MTVQALLPVAVALLIAKPVVAGDKTDVVVLRNGDRLTCEIQGLEMGVLYVTHDDVDGTMRIQWSKVDRIESSHLFIVKTQDGSVFTGAIREGRALDGRSNTLHVHPAQNQEVTLKASQVTELSETSESFWKRFDGAVSLGVVYSKANQNTQYSLSTETEYARERWSTVASYSSSLSTSSRANVATRNNANLLGFHLLPRPNYFYGGLAEFLQSSEQGIDLQTTLGGGVGRYLKNGRNTRVSVFGGLAWQGTDYKQLDISQTHQNVATAFVAADLRFFKFSATNLNLNATLFPVLSDPGRVRFNTNTTYYLKLFSDLKWNVSFYGNWDNRPPNNFATSDYGTSSGLSWTYGAR
jgi:Protein of unknown function, DUF481